MYDVKRYGAVGDGLTNDTIAIQNAINAANAANANGGGVIYFPNSIYLTDNLTLFSNIQILGKKNKNHFKIS